MCGKADLRTVSHLLYLEESVDSTNVEWMLEEGREAEVRLKLEQEISAQLIQGSIRRDQARAYREMLGIPV